MFERAVGCRATGPARAPASVPIQSRCSADRSSVAVALFLLLAAASPETESLSLVHQQRYSMGTMFDVVVYHASREDAARAIARALDEIVRLDRVMSHFKPDSDLSTLLREGRSGFVAVEPCLYEVIRASMMFSRRSGGRFDVTVAPLLRVWREASAEGRRPSADDVSAARRCIGYEKIETRAPDRIRFHSDCLEIDLGGIGKGYAVDRAIAVLEASGVRHALVNAGNSSIASIGAPPGATGWPVELGASVSGRRTLLLRDASISTSRQKLVPFSLDSGTFGEILDLRTGAPLESGMTVSVMTPSATVSDALSTTLLMFSTEEGANLLGQFGDVSAVWISPAGELKAAYRESRLELSESR
jgi:thiamine biosynthesis lipoprotein